MGEKRTRLNRTEAESAGENRFFEIAQEKRKAKVVS